MPIGRVAEVVESGRAGAQEGRWKQGRHLGSGEGEVPMFISQGEARSQPSFEGIGTSFASVRYPDIPGRVNK